MAWVETRITRTTQPQDACGIDWNNPLARGLVDAFDFTGVPRSVILRTPVTFFATRPTLGVATQAGRAIDTTANGFGCYFQRSDGAYATAEQTHIAVANFSGGGTNFGAYFLTSDAAGANQVIGLGYVNSENSYFTDGTNTSFSTPGIGNNNFKVKVMSVGGGSVRFYNDGLLGGTLSRTATARATSRIRFFGDHASFFVKGRSALHLIFNRALSDAEIKSLSDNPWQLFEPEVTRIWVDDYVSAGGGATGTLAATETGSDTAVLSGQIVVQGALSATETGADAASIAGKVIITGTLAATEVGSDTAALNGSAAVTLTGTLAATEQGSDTATLAGKVLVQGALSASEVGSDTALINGSSVIITSGTLNAQESGGDTAMLAGKVLVTGALSGQELGSDTASLAGAAAVTGVRYWNGATWAYGTLRYWNGSVWGTGTLRYWNGTNWSIP